MRMSIGSFLALLAAMWAAGPASAQDTGAKNSTGNWETASNWTGGAVPGSSNNVYIGSTYPSGAASTATVTLTANEAASNVYLGNGSGTSGTLDLGGKTLTIGNNLVIGQSGGTGVLNEGGGSFTATNAYVENGNSLTFGAKDAVGYLELDSKSTATTAASGNVTGGIDVLSGSTLTAGADLKLSGTLNVEDSGSVLNMQNHNITADSVQFGYNGSTAVTLQNLGNITSTNLYIGNGMAFNLTSADSVTNFYLNEKATSTLTNNVSYLQLQNGSSATTTSSGSATGGIDVLSGSTLTAGADLKLTGTLNVEDSGSVLNMQNHNITADTVLFGYNGSTAVSVTDLGQVSLSSLYIGHATDLTLHGGDVIGNQLTLSGNSILTVDQVGGTGLTLNGTSLSNLTIDPSSMDLIFTSTAPVSWDFRWKDPSSTQNWISTLDTMITDGQIVLSGATSYSVVDQNGYTYIEGFASQSVPEPSSIVLMCLAGTGMAAGAAWRRRRQGQ